MGDKEPEYRGRTVEVSDSSRASELGQASVEAMQRKQAAKDKEINYSEEGRRMIKSLQQQVMDQRKLLDRIYAEIDWAAEHELHCISLSALRWVLFGEAATRRGKDQADNRADEFGRY